MHCSYREYKNLDNFQLKNLSIIPTYRFLRLIDKVKYFACSNINMRKGIKLSKIKKLKEKPFYNKMYIYQSKNPIIPSTVEELQFFSAEGTFTLDKNIFQIASTNNLAVLSFISIQSSIQTFASTRRQTSSTSSQAALCFTPQYSRTAEQTTMESLCSSII